MRAFRNWVYFRRHCGFRGIGLLSGLGFDDATNGTRRLGQPDEKNLDSAKEQKK